MAKQAISVGDKLHIITRRRFDGDLRRHFAGEVTAMSGELQELQGYAFVLEQGTNEYKRQPEFRTRLFSVGQEGFIATKLPAEVDIASLQYRTVDERLVVADGGSFSLQINEFGSMR